MEGKCWMCCKKCQYMLKALTYLYFIVLHITSSTLETRYIWKPSSVFILLFSALSKTFFIYHVCFSINSLCPNSWLMFSEWNSEVEIKICRPSDLIRKEQWSEICLQSNNFMVAECDQNIQPERNIKCVLSFIAFFRLFSFCWRITQSRWKWV